MSMDINIHCMNGKTPVRIIRDHRVPQDGEVLEFTDASLRPAEKYVVVGKPKTVYWCHDNGPR